MIRLRPATEADAPGLLALMATYYAEDSYPLDASRAAAALTPLLSDGPPGRAWVFVREADVVGYVVATLGYSMEYGGTDAFVDELYLAPDVRGAGLGTQALATVEDWCRAQGAGAVHLEVERHREQAQALYRRRGYRDNGRLLLSLRLD